MRDEIVASVNTMDKHETTIVKRSATKRWPEEHGVAWKVAFADFCLALMALFLMLWLMAVREHQNLQKIVRDAVGDGMLQNMSRTRQIGDESRASLIERFELPVAGIDGPGKLGISAQARVAYESAADLTALSKALDELSAEAGLAPNLDTVLTPHGLRIMLHDTDKQGMFMRGSALPTSRLAYLLRKMGPLFGRMHNQMLIIGHTDSSRFAGADSGRHSNWALSTHRALSARAELLDGGMRPDSVLQVVGMADRGPLDATDPFAGVNRRIELLILPSAQSRAMSSMFGALGGSDAPAREGAILVPDAAALETLRSRLPK